MVVLEFAILFRPRSVANFYLKVGLNLIISDSSFSFHSWCLLLIFLMWLLLHKTRSPDFCQVYVDVDKVELIALFLKIFYQSCNEISRKRPHDAHLCVYLSSFHPYVCHMRAF